jgi:hypothetical protein
MITLENSRLKFSEDLYYSLYLMEGLLVDVNYTDNLTPILIINGESGNKLCKNLTVAFKGKKHKQLSKYGTTFKVKETANGLELIGDGKISEYEYPFEVEPVKPEIILDTTYIINKFKKYEL